MAKEHELATVIAAIFYATGSKAPSICYTDAQDFIARCDETLEEQEKALKVAEDKIARAKRVEEMKDAVRNQQENYENHDKVAILIDEVTGLLFHHPDYTPDRERLQSVAEHTGRAVRYFDEVFTPYAGHPLNADPLEFYTE